MYIELELHELRILYSHSRRGGGGGGGVAATNCDSILRKCSFTMHIRFCMRSLIQPNAKPSRLNLAWIDSSHCSPRRPKPTWLVFAHCRVWSSNRCGTVASGHVFPEPLVEMKHIVNPTCTLNVVSIPGLVHVLVPHQ